MNRLLRVLIERLVDNQVLWEVGGIVSASGAEAFVLRVASRLVHRDVHAAEFGHHFVETVLHFLRLLRLSRVADQVFLLHRVRLDVEELVGIPQAVVGRVLVFVAPQRKHGWRLREVFLPVVAVEEVVAPGDVLTAGQVDEAGSVHVRRLLQAHRLHDRRGDVDVGDHFVDDGSALEQVRALHEHRDADRGLIGDAFVDQTVLTEHEAVVAHVDDERLIMETHLFQLLENRSHTVVDRAQRLAVALVVLLDVEVTVVGKIDAVPAVTLVEQPARQVA